MTSIYGNIDMTPLSDEQLERASRKQLLTLIRGEQQLRGILEDFIEETEAREHEMKEKLTLIEGLYYKIRCTLFRPRSERSAKASRSGTAKSSPKEDQGPRLPSERYPDAEIIDKHITAAELPVCRSCGSQMEDSGLTETSEYLTVVPKQYIVVRQHRHTYRCRCHGDLVTTPALPRIIPGSSYSDEMAVDVSLSKYCDLIPMERYSQMAKRQGFAGIPPQSLIGLSQKLAVFFQEAYDKVREETLESPVLMADETPHKMLEGDEKKGWYLWGFSNQHACFFECHPSRSGEIASVILNSSRCEVLVSDVYSGYRRPVREANDKRRAEGLPEIAVAYCNAHARRGFKGIAEEETDSAQFMVEAYKVIYAIEAETKGKSLEERASARQEMRPYFETMKAHAEAEVVTYSSKSGIARAFNYFLKNYDGLTKFLDDPRVPIDNNASERLLRSPVVGRKTWSSRSGRLPSPTSHRTERDSLLSFGSCWLKNSSSSAQIISGIPFSACSGANLPWPDNSSAS